MVAVTLVTGSLLSIAAGAAYKTIGLLHLRPSPERRARSFLALFWLGTGFFGVSDGAWSLAVATGDVPLAVGVTILHLKLVAGTVGFFGLVAYMRYVYTGTWAHLRPLAAFYALVYALVLYAYVAQDPIGQEIHTWRAGLVYRTSGLASLAAPVLLFLPPLVAAIAYARLAPRSPDPHVRARIVVTSLAFGVFFGSLLVAWMASGLAWWPPVEKLLALATAAAVLWAIRGIGAGPSTPAS